MLFQLGTRRAGLPEHSLDTLTTRRDLARFHAGQGDYAVALQLAADLPEIWRRLYIPRIVGPSRYDLTLGFDARGFENVMGHGDDREFDSSTEYSSASGRKRLVERRFKADA